MSAKTSAVSSNQATLTFDDEFNSLSIWNGTSGNWQYAYSWAPNGVDTNGGWFVNPTWGPTSAAGVDPYSVNNGVLSIGLIPTPASVLSSVNNEPSLTGQVETQASFSQLYGYFEVNAEASATPGVNSAFWLLPENGAWPPELDVFEILGSQPTNVYMTAHYGSSNSITQNWATLSDATTAFNTYAVDWEANYITWYINGKQVAQIATPASMNVPMYMLLDLAAGTTGSWAGKPASGATGQMLVNWAHAYTSDPYLSANDAVVTAGSSAAITDHAGNSWTVTSGGQVAINGTVDAATSGVTEIAFVNSTIWKETSAGLWSGETQPNNSWSTATSVSPLPAGVTVTAPAPAPASANDTIVKAGSTAAITDASGNVWTITSGGQVAVNGTADAATSKVAELAYVNGTIWQETTAGLWSGETHPNNSWSAATTTNPLTGVVPAASPNDTVVLAGSTAAIIDSSGNAWTITSGGQVAVNGATSQGTANVIEMAYVNGTIWQENSMGLWYGESKPNNSWSAGTTVSPLPAALPAASPNDTIVLAGSTVSITDTSGNAWTITSGGQVAVNGATSQGTANVIEMAYVNGTIWQENTAGLWYGESQPNNSWSAGTAVAPLATAVTVPATEASVSVAVISATINASSGNHSFIVSGHSDTFNLSGGVETITDNGSGANTFKLPAAGSGSAVFNAAVLSNADVFDLTTALSGTSWTGSASTLSSYLHTLQSGANAELLVSAAATRHGTGTLLATFDNSSASLTTILAHSLT